MKRCNKTIIVCLTLVLLTQISAFASPCDEKSCPLFPNDPGLIYEDPDTGIKIYRDATGGTVLQNLPIPSDADLEEIEEQLKNLDILLENESEIPKLKSRHYDIENNPILIGYWNKGDCGPNDYSTYARHTIGELHYVENKQYLLSYGDASWYNSSGYTALPYRNGANTVSDDHTIDVKKGSYFDIRDMDTNKSMRLKVNDFGPNQCPGSKYTKRIVDLDKNDFKQLHENTDSGILYCRTWVPLSNYNPK